MTKYKKTLIGFERVDNEPLEKNVVFATSAELTTYLQSDPTKYNGQVVTVKGNGTSTKGISYRIDQLGNTWKAVPLADSEDVATKAQGGKADTAVQAATIGGTAVPKSGTTLQMPAYPTSLPASDKSTILSEAATDAQNKVNAHANDPTKHITAAERNTWNAAIQSATVGGTAVPKSGTALQFPAYPTSLPASDKVTILSEAATTAQSKVDAAIKTNVTDKKGAANGLATLDGTGKVPANQLPSYVDDVIELRGFDIPNTASGFVSNDLMYKTTDKKIYYYAGTSIGWVVKESPESGKIYVNLTDNKTYRWSGSDMAVISETLALGETSATAYPGDKGKTNATNIANLQNNKLDKAGDGSNITSTFTQAASRANIVTGEKLSVILGKVSKWFGDLKALAFKATVGENDIDDNSIGYSKLDNQLKDISTLTTEYLSKGVPLIVETADSPSATKLELFNSLIRLDAKTKISGIKKYVYIEIEKGRSDEDLICIQDESGNIVTDLFMRTVLPGDISYEYSTLCDLETLYISYLN